MTLESSLPWLSALAAVGAGVATGAASRPAERALKSLAFSALAVFAYFRWIAPTEIALALTLAAIGQAVLPRAFGFVCIGSSWLAFAWLFLLTGDGPTVLVSDALKAGMFALLALAAVLALRRLWRAPPGPRLAVLAAAVALLLMAATAITLDWSFWPAIGGAGGVVLSQLIGLAASPPPPQAGAASRRSGGEAAPSPRRAVLLRRLSWACSWLSHAAIAYAFLK